MAAEQGNASAEVNLGNKCAIGEGVPQDPKEAVKWYRVAAEQGSASGQYHLAVEYDQGVGVVQDYKLRGTPKTGQ